MARIQDERSRDRPAAANTGQRTTPSIRFYDDNGNIRPELVDSEASSWAQKLVGGAPSDGVKGVSRHQFRRVYDELKRIRKRVHGGREQWERARLEIKLVKSKTDYLVARAKQKSGLEKYYDAFRDLIWGGIDAVKNEKDYDVFCKMLEAVYGFYYGRGGARVE